MLNDLLSERNLEAAKEAALNQFRGKVNELAFLHYMREHIAKTQGGDMKDDDTHPLRFLNKEERKEHARNAEFLDVNEFSAQHKRAKAQLESFIEHAKISGYEEPIDVHHTALPGDIGRVTGHNQSQTENPSDALVRFKKGPTPFLGASLKSSKKSEIGFHNGGAGTIGKSLGIDLENIATKRREEFANQNGLGKSDVARKKSIKENPELYDRALAAGGKLHTEIADTLHNHYSEMDPEELRHHLVSTFLKSDEDNPVPYVKVTGRGGYGDKPAQAHTEHHHDNPVTNSLLSAQRVTTRRSGAGMIHVLADGKHAFTIQAKHNSTPMATSMKLIGQPAAEVKKEAGEKAKTLPSLPIPAKQTVAPSKTAPVRARPTIKTPSETSGYGLAANNPQSPMSKWTGGNDGTHGGAVFRGPTE